MTAPTKIHLPATDELRAAARADGKREPATLCGRQAPAERIVDDLDDATCDVCIVNRSRQAGPTVLDRFRDADPRRVPDLTPKRASDDPARDAALKELAARHLDEFLALYRAELARAGRT